MNQINTLLIANRGEIASRIIRTCRKMGIRTVAVFSDADRGSLFVKEADIAVHAGGSNPSESYLNQEKILEIARQQQADAIHPGYGFLSENATFARQCQQAGIIFIGPNAAAIEAMGSKSRAKTLMQSHGVPVIPGYQGDDQSLKTLTKAAKKIGFPLLLKATAGGGGKGMRIVERLADLEKNIEAARREAKSAFGEDELIIEKYISKGRHIEFQIFGDQQGNAVHILERECTIQRRYQKVLEESPSPVLDETLRQKMGEAAINAAKALNYDNAGTVEFIFDDSTGEFYFLEVNTRLQVEHPVTEEITGLDLVQMQIEVAEGQPLSIEQRDVQGMGYAIEARLYAEDATRDFQPATGTIHHWEVPEVEGLRVETAVESGSAISIYYDPMIAKLIVWDKTRSLAHRKMAYVLKNLKCQGLTTNQDFLLHLFQQPAILKGAYDTHYLKNHFDKKALLVRSAAQNHLAAIATTLYNWQHREQQRTLLQAIPSGWRNNRYAPQAVVYSLEEKDYTVHYTSKAGGQFELEIDATKYAVTLIHLENTRLHFSVNRVYYQGDIIKEGNRYYFHSAATGNVLLTEKERFPVKESAQLKGGYTAPMPSQIVKILVQEGQTVAAGDALMVISSMKMENTIEAASNGLVQEVFAAEGQHVEAGFLLLNVKES